MTAFPHEFPQLFLVVLLLSLTLTGAGYLLARKAPQLLPAIRDRDVHTTRKPRIGGVAMWLGIILAFGGLLLSPTNAHLLDFHNGTQWGIDRSLIGIVLGMIVLLGMGLLDDIRGLSAGRQLGGQFLAALMLVLCGVGVQYITLPFGGQLRLDQIALHLGGQTLYLWSSLFTMLWVMTMINVLNWFDGLDGLAGSIAMTAAAVLVFVSLRLGFLATATVAVILCAAAAGFLPWNWYPSKLFMGTVGSQTLGFLLAAIAIISGGKVATAVIVLGIPLFDAVIVVCRRLLDGVSPFRADQRHLHHRLLKIGLPVPWAVVLVNVVSILFGVLAYRTQNAADKGLLTLMLALLMAAVIIATYMLERRRIVISNHSR